MIKTEPQNSPFTASFNRAQLIKLKARAMRSGAWFKALLRIDRALVDLTIRVTENIRSPSLARSILAITRKLEGLMESKFLRAIREIGLPLAQKLSTFAQTWGNKDSKQWVNDKDFARYLAVMKLNGHPCGSCL